MSTTPEVQNQQFGLRRGAEEFPLMLVISIIYPCNFGCPNCPYTDANSEIRQFYHQHDGDLFPVDLWNKLALELTPHRLTISVTGDTSARDKPGSSSC